MKRTVYSFLLVLAATPVYAAALNAEDWAYYNDSPPEGTFTFSEGTLIATGNSNGKILLYKVSSQTPLMTNGSGLSITLQFDSNDFFENEEDCSFFIELYDGNPNPILTRFTVFNSNGQLNFYDSKNNLDQYYSREDCDGDTLSVTVKYTVKDHYLHYSYTLNNSITGKEYVWEEEQVNSTLAWRPAFGVSHSDGMKFTVTDVSFTTNTIPEPSVAMLSLLALSGLITRRRRR